MNIPSHIKLANIPNKGKGLISNKKFEKNMVVLKFDHGITIRPNSTASVTALQIDEDAFLDSKPKQIRDFLNHSCRPNVRIDFNKMGCISIRKINPGDEITFSYVTTEYDLAIKNESFQCFCGSKNCIRVVKGFKHLKKEHQIKLKPLLTPYLLRKFS
jgi:hypothetical protein